MGIKKCKYCNEEIKYTLPMKDIEGKILLKYNLAIKDIEGNMFKEYYFCCRNCVNNYLRKKDVYIRLIP